MASATEQLTFELAIDATQANIAIDKTRDRINAFGANISKASNQLTEGFSKFDDSANGIFSSLNTNLKTTEQQFSDSFAAIQTTATGASEDLASAFGNLAGGFSGGFTPAAEDGVGASNDLADSFKNLAGDAEALKKSFDDVGTGATAAGDAFDSVGKNQPVVGTLKKLQSGADELDGQLGKLERTTRGVGQVFGATNSTLMDSVGAVADLAQSFAQGGLFGLAATAATVAISKLINEFKELNDKIDRADKAWEDFITPLTKLRDELEKTSKDGVQELKTQLANISATPFEQEINKVVPALENLYQKLADVREKISHTFDEEENNKLRIQLSLYEQQIRTIQKTASERGKLATEIERQQNAAENAANAEQQRAKDELDHQEKLNKLFATINTWKKEREDEEEEANKRANDQMIADEEEMQQTLFQMREKDADRLHQMQMDQFNKEEDIKEQRLKSTTDAWSQVFSVGVSATQMLTDAVIKGQEDAFAVVAEYLMRQAGQAMIAHGIDAAAGGAAQLALTFGAKGSESLGLGLALIAGGVALGGIATGIESITGASGGSQQNGATAEQERRKNEMDSARAGGVGGGSRNDRNSSQGSVTIVNNYGLGVPMEKSGRDMQQLLTFMRRQGMRA